MIPDFSKNTIENLAKRAAYKCSNPDCRINTIGPNSDPEKSTVIGEAAHIYGARIGSKRYHQNMTDTARAEITNSIWLCRNCHKLTDTDEMKYSANTLFIWREQHEKYIASTLGSVTDKIVYEEQLSNISEFDGYPPIIKRIIIDQPDGWEYRLTAELMRFQNGPIFRKLDDLRNGLYLKPLENINDDNAFNWLQAILAELSRIAGPAVGLLDQLTKSWGKLGEPGDAKEIHHVTKLIKNYLEHVISIEERIYFANVPQKYEAAVNLLKDLIGSQVNKLSDIPGDLDEIVTLIESHEENEDSGTPKRIVKEITFELPKNWETQFQKELNKLGGGYQIASSNNSSSGCLSVFVILIFILGLILIR